jgi:hypothetical protein
VRSDVVILTIYEHPDDAHTVIYVVRGHKVRIPPALEVTACFYSCFFCTFNSNFNRKSPTYHLTLKLPLTYWALSRPLPYSFKAPKKTLFSNITGTRILHNASQQ